MLVVHRGVRTGAGGRTYRAWGGLTGMYAASPLLNRSTEGTCRQRSAATDTPDALRSPRLKTVEGLLKYAGISKYFAFPAIVPAYNVLLAKVRVCGRVCVRACMQVMALLFWVLACFMDGGLDGRMGR